MAALSESRRLQDIQNPYALSGYEYESLGRGRRKKVASPAINSRFIDSRKITSTSKIEGEKSLRYLLSLERQSTAIRQQEVHHIFAEDGSVALEGTYVNDQKIREVITAHTQRRANKKAEMKGARLSHAYGDVFEQLAADCYMAYSQPEGETILGKDGTTLLYNSVFKWPNTEDSKTIFNNSGLSIPDLTVMNKERVTTVLEATLSQDQDYFSHKVEMFDRNRERIQDPQMLSTAQLLFLVPNNAQYSTIKSEAEWGDRADIDILQLPICRDSVETFTNRLLHVPPRVVFSRNRSN